MNPRELQAQPNKAPYKNRGRTHLMNITAVNVLLYWLTRIFGQQLGCAMDISNAGSGGAVVEKCRGLVYLVLVFRSKEKKKIYSITHVRHMSFSTCS